MVIKVRLRKRRTQLFCVISREGIFPFFKQDLRIDICRKSYTISIEDLDREGKLINLERQYACFITNFWLKKELIMWDFDDQNNSADNFHWCLGFFLLLFLPYVPILLSSSSSSSSLSMYLKRTFSKLLPSFRRYLPSVVTYLTSFTPRVIALVFLILESDYK